MTLVYDRRGSGEPLLLIHGLGSRWQIWEPILDRVAKKREVISVDLPGFGASPPDETAPTVDGFASRLEKFCAELGLVRPHVAGNSMGGGIALELGRRGAARSVTAFSPIGFWHTPGRLWAQHSLGAARALGRRIRPAVPRLMASPRGKAAFTGLVFARPGNLSPDLARLHVDGILDAPNFKAAAAAFAYHRFHDAAALEHIPVTVAWGQHDLVLTTRTQRRRARQALPYAQHVLLPGCGHSPFFDDADLCADVLLHGSLTTTRG